MNAIARTHIDARFVLSRLAVADELKSGELVAVKFADWKIKREFYRLRLKGNYESRAARGSCFDDSRIQLGVLTR